MATQLEDDDDLIEDVEVEEDEDDAPDTDQGDGDDDDNDPADEDEPSDDEEDVITFAGAEQRGEDEPEHIRGLRQSYRDLKRENEALKAATAPKVEDIGPKPKLDDYWDRDDPEGDFERDLLAHNERTRQAKERDAEQQRQAEAAQREWEADKGEFETQRSALKVGDFDSSYDKVTGTLSEVQQAIVVQASTNKAALVYALGKNPDRLAEIAKITNPVKFTAAVARLDMETKVQRRKPSTAPESAARGSGTLSAGRGDAKLARLEAEADRSGDRTALIAYKKSLRKDD